MILAELIDEYISGDWGNEEISNETPNAVFCIRAADFVPILSVDYTNIPTRYISDASFENKLLKVGDIVIEKSGGSPTQSTGRVIIITEELLKEKQHIVCSNFCEAFRVKENWNPFYVFSYLQFLYNEGVFFNFEGKTSGLKNLQMEQAFNSIDIPEQKSDISVLASIDEKIALNRKINIELEALAKQIYDYWFVQFDFPNEDGKPYKSSGGKMVWNETLKREIPDGWEVSSYGKEFTVKLGGTPSTEISEYWKNGSYHWMNSGEVQLFPVTETEKTITQEAIDNSTTALLPTKSVLISITRHLRVTILGIDACINQSVVGFSESDKLKCLYTYYALKMEVPRLMNLRTGAQQPHINKETVEDCPIILPDDKVLEKYYLLTENVFDNILNIGKEILNLEKLRSYLLPLLMNGQITIKD